MSVPDSFYLGIPPAPGILRGSFVLGTPRLQEDPTLLTNLVGECVVKVGHQLGPLSVCVCVGLSALPL